MNTGLRSSGLSLALLLLTACALPKGTPPDGAQPGPAVAGAPSGESGESQAEPDQNALATLPPPPALSPDELLGLDGPALEARLGPPELVRNEAPAQIWQYRSETCVFDVFLYPSAGINRVTYLEARDQETAQVDKQNCLSDIMALRKAGAV